MSPAKGLRAVPLARTSRLERGKPLTARTGLTRTAGLPSVSAGRVQEGAKPKGKSAATRRAVTAPRRDESFPPDVAALIDARDPWCIHCGSPRDLQRHHRRIRGIGGDGRDHTHCACNGVRVCAAEHAWIHDTAEGRREAEAEGLIIPRSTLEPWTLAVLVHLEEDRGGQHKYPTCDGRWADDLSEVAA